MSRRAREIKRKKLLPDPRFQSVRVTKFINKIMWDGKKSTAERVVYSALDVIAQKSGQDALEVFEKAMTNTRPLVEVKARRVGGATYQVPIEVSKDRQDALAMRWLIGYSRDRKGNSMVEKLSAELLDAANNTGAAVKKKEDTHKMAEANKAFAHYRW